MAKNKIITSQGNVQFINSKGKTISVHPWHVYAVYENDTVSFLFVGMKDYSGQAIFASQYDDLEVNGVSYDNMEDLKEAISVAFAHAGAQARAEIVDELPEDPYTNTIYLVKKEHGEGYDEYIWNEEKEEWELIGDTDIEFERYLQITDFNAYSAATKTYIDSVSASTVANHNDIVSLSGAIDTEISARTAADEALSGAVDNVSSALTEEAQRAISAETALGNRIDTVNGRVDAEQTARAQADTALSGAIDTVSGAVASEATARANADAALSGAIDTEVSARTAADEAISGAVDTLSSGLTDEASARANADSALSGAIETVDGKIDAETSARESADTAINGAINNLSTDLGNEVSARTAADEALETKVEAVSGALETMGDEAIVDAAYVSSATTIEFYNASGTVVASIDASDFIKDGMIEDVRIETISGVTYLVIDFNTASGIEDIKIPMTDFFNPANYYDKTAIDGIVSGLNDSIDAKFDASGITAYSTSAEVTAEIEAAVSGKADADSVVDESVFSAYSASVETALSGKQNVLTAGSGITISGDVISADAQEITIDPTLDSGSTNPVANSAVTNAIIENENITSAALNDLNTRKAEASALTEVAQSIEGTVEEFMTYDGRVDYLTAKIAPMNGSATAMSEYFASRDASSPYVLTLEKNFQLPSRNTYTVAGNLGEVTGVTISNELKEEFGISQNATLTYIKVMTVLKKSYYNTIPSELKNANPSVFIKLNQYIDKPYLLSDASSDWNEWDNWGSFYPSSTWSSIENDDYVLLYAYYNSYGNNAFSGTSGKTINGAVDDANNIGEFVICIEFDDMGSYKDIILPLANSEIENIDSALMTTHYKDGDYKVYDGEEIYASTSAVTAVSNVANSALTVANSALTVANAAMAAASASTPSDWNISSSGTPGYIYNRPFYESSSSFENIEWQGYTDFVEKDYPIYYMNLTFSGQSVSVGNYVYIENEDYMSGGWQPTFKGHIVENNGQYPSVQETYVVTPYDSGDVENSSWLVSNDLVNWTYYGNNRTWNQTERFRVTGSTTTLVQLDSKFIANDIARSSRLGGLSLVKITQSAYDALVQAGTTDPNTLYIISD